jgi:hypothetical protein
MAKQPWRFQYWWCTGCRTYTMADLQRIESLIRNCLPTGVDLYAVIG